MKSDYYTNQDPATRDDFYLFLLSKIKGLGKAGLYSLIKQFGELDQKKLSFFPERYRKIITKALADKTFLEEIKNLWSNIDEPYISIYHSQYPTILKNIYDPPLFLFYRGNLNILSNKNIITIVGSRTLTSYHTTSCHKIISQLKNTPLVIASGMALGIDSLAHSTAIENNLPTIAVLGSGLDKKIIYPQRNIQLAQKIISSGGLLISEYDKNTKTQIHHFPSRNRILAGIAKTTIVISGNIKSGTLITARVAIDEGRDVYALPGNINISLSEGPNNLISNGAYILKSAEDILKDHNINYKITKRKIIFKNKNHAKIYSILQTESINLKTLSYKLQLPPEVLNIQISEMELLGLIKTNKQNIIEII